VCVERCVPVSKNNAACATLLSLVLLACAPPAKSARPVPAHSATAIVEPEVAKVAPQPSVLGPPSARASSGLTDTCQPALRAYQASELTRVRAAAKIDAQVFSAFDDWMSTDQDQNRPSLCLGNWALVVKAFSEPAPPAQPEKLPLSSCDAWPGGVCVTYALVYAETETKRTEYSLNPQYHFRFENSGYARPFKSAAFDYDGDGVTELLLVLEKWENESPEHRQLLGFSFRGAKIAPLALPADAHAEDLVDADGDGRPDVVGHLRYSSPDLVACGSGFDYRLSGPKFLWHALPEAEAKRGTLFSSEDKQAQDFARAQCGPKPQAGRIFGPEVREEEKREPDYAWHTKRAMCARMWGISEIVIKQEVARAKALTGKCETKTEVIPHATQIPTVLGKWIAQPPPFAF
jgi:hypothetical protein